MKRKMNNRGFTLVELIVSTAILAIIAMGAGAFMVAGTRAYSSLNYTVRLQYEAQLAMAQLQEYTVDCNQGIAWIPSGTGGTLYIANTDKVHVFKCDSGTITYSDSAFGDTLNFTAPGAVKDALLAEHLKSMSVAFIENDPPVENVSPAKAKRVEITLQMERGGKSYTATQVIALRNQPACAESATSWADLYAAIKYPNNIT